MRIAILADIHANLEALEAVLEDAARQRCTSHACLGDLVGFNAAAAACVDLVQGLDCPVVKGDFDEASSGSPDFTNMNSVAASAFRRDWLQLGPQRRHWLGRLPLTVEIEGSTLVHSSLDRPSAWCYVVTSVDAASSFAWQESRVCFHGHTHVPRVFRREESKLTELPPDHLKLDANARYLINAGSVGQPRDGDPRACYVIHDLEQGTVTFRRVDYDVGSAQRKILDAGLPPLLAERLEQGR
jgi:diadenosine tetraphosphatase ApaH/serine/threonine PP2A family protein phosphatase